MFYLVEVIEDAWKVFLSHFIVFILGGILGGVLIWIWLGSYLDLVLGEFVQESLVDRFLMVWWWSSNALLGGVGAVWGSYLVIHTIREIYNHYSSYQSMIWSGDSSFFTKKGLPDYRLDVRVWNPLKIGDNGIPTVIKWVFFIYSWPLVVLAGWIMMGMIILEIVLSLLIEGVDNKIKNMMIRKNLAISHFSQIDEIRSRATKISEDAKK